MAVILIVDDDPVVREIATEMLRADDHAILEASDGDEALRILQAVAVDVVVLDMLMPNKDGLEAIMEIRRARSKVRILAISSGGSINLGDLLKTATIFGADAVMQKPLRVGPFAQKIAELVAFAAPSDDMFGDTAA